MSILHTVALLVFMVATTANAQTVPVIQLGARGLNEIRATPSPWSSVYDSDASEQTLFKNVTSAVRLADGSVLIADAGARELRQFDKTGAFLKLWGRQGRGPGEFTSLSWMTTGSADTVFTYDRSLRRLSQFHNGAFVRQWLLTDVVKSATPMDAVGVSHAGEVLVRAFMPETADESIARSPQDYLVASMQQTAQRSLGVVPGDEVFRGPTKSGGRMLGTPPFQRRSLNAVGARYAAIGDTETGDIRIVNLATSAEVRIRALERDTLIIEADLKARLIRMASPEQPASMRAQWAANMSEMITSKRLPAFDALQFDAQDNLWVLRYDRTQAGVGSWVVIATNGAPVARVTLPANCEARQIRTTDVTCLEKNADGQQGVVTYAFPNLPVKR